jgi:hypothetical protein
MEVTGYQQWLPIVAAARFYEHIEREQSWLIEPVTKELNKRGGPWEERSVSRVETIDDHS